MLILPNTTDLIRVVTGNAVATDVTVHYVDHTSTAYTPGRQLTAISTATTTTICSSPAASTQRSIKCITICARAGAQTVVVQYFDGTNAFQFVGGTTFALAQGDTLQFTDENGWLVIQSNGPGQGRLLGIQYITGATTSITHATGSTTTVVEGVGGGGAGGGANAAAGAIGANGGSGTWGRVRRTLVGLASTCAIGAAGVGVSGANGGNGGNTTFTHNGTTMTLPGGNGGTSAAGGVVLATAAGGANATAATNADVSVTGQAGGDAIRLTTTNTGCWHTNGGGSNPLGQGASGNVVGNATVVAGGTPTGFGSGGGGVLNGTTVTASAGTNGGAGILIVYDYA